LDNKKVKIGGAFRLSSGAGPITLKQELVTTRIDRVHPIDWVSEKPHHRITQISRKRFGESYDNKHTWVMVLPMMSDQMGGAVHPLYDNRPPLTIAASLYTYLQTEKVNCETDFSGDAHGILSTPTAILSAAPTAIIFYSVGKYNHAVRGLGEMIINQVSEQYMALYPDVKLSTLSPLREFGAWLKGAYSDNDLDALRTDDDSLHMLAMQYLGENRDRVQAFHSRNGAYIGDIKLHANMSGSEDDRQGLNVMVNYVYPTNIRERLTNKSLYADGVVQFAPHLGVPDNDKRFRIYGEPAMQQLLRAPQP